MASMTQADMLADAEAKLHALLTGTQVVQIQDQNGEKITFNAAKAQDLRSYIQDLRASLGLPMDPRLISRPLRFIF